MLERLVQRQEAGAQAGGGGEDADFRMWDDQWQARPRRLFTGAHSSAAAALSVRTSSRRSSSSGSDVRVIGGGGHRSRRRPQQLVHKEVRWK